MKPFPEGLVGTIPSAKLREGVKGLGNDVLCGPVGIQRWDEPITLVLMSRESFDSMWQELVSLRGRSVDQG